MSESHDQAPAATVTSQVATKDISILAQYWKGYRRLRKAFWELGLLVHLVFIPAVSFMNAVQIPFALKLIIAQAITIPLYTFWAVSIWRSARRTSHWVFSLLARGTSILIAIGVLAIFVNLVAFSGRL